MPTPTDENDIAMSVCLPRDLRLELEKVRLQRGCQEGRLPSLRGLVEEALTTFVKKEAARR